MSAILNKEEPQAEAKGTRRSPQGDKRNPEELKGSPMDFQRNISGTHRGWEGTRAIAEVEPRVGLREQKPKRSTEHSSGCRRQTARDPNKQLQQANVQNEDGEK